ncbi:MAG: hypothetical protein JXO72_03795 [Vicinamibacteria bacterium]|nr:hypothetical protein [Vicinamibacteria bacterium]
MPENAAGIAHRVAVSRLVLKGHYRHGAVGVKRLRGTLRRVVMQAKLCRDRADRPSLTMVQPPDASHRLTIDYAYLLPESR